jgi:group I intron endonuclease
MKIKKKNNMKNSYIYKITSPIGKVYIGQTTNLKNRIKNYKSLHCKSQPKIYNSLSKYGWDMHQFEIIEEIIYEGDDLSLLNEREIFWIAEYDSHKNGMNCSDGGSNRKLSEETKAKLSKAKLGKKLSKEVCLIFSKAQTGRKHPEEVKKKMSESQMGEKNHRYGKTHKHSEETKKKIGAGRKGKIHTEESKRKMSQNRKNNPNVRKCKIIVDGVVYNSIKEAAIILNMNIGKLKWRLISKNFTDVLYA